MTSKSFNSKKRKALRERTYYRQEGRCAECRRDCVLTGVHLTLIDSTAGCGQDNLRVLCELCTDAHCQRRRAESAARVRGTGRGE